jgi:hypothetical protein
MKNFTEPTGKFKINIPINWRYVNVGAGYEEKSPFSFQPYENSHFAFQISCYSKDEKAINFKGSVQNFNCDNLNYVEMRMDDNEHNIHLWGAVVEDHLIMAKLIYDRESEKEESFSSVIEQVKKSLSTLQLYSPERRTEAFNHDKFEKFVASIAASHDIKTAALHNHSFIEFTIIVANQIDAYLRMSIILNTQLKNKNDSFDIKYVYQSDSDKVISERSIYKEALDEKIIEQNLFDDLELLYKERNKMVHRYIISELITRDLIMIAYKYEKICEKVNSILRELEDRQIELRIGTYGNGAFSDTNYTDEALNFLYAQVNDKHLTEQFERKINAPNGA